MGKDLLKLALNLPSIIWILLRRFAEAWAEESVDPILQNVASWAGVPVVALEGFLAGVLLVSSLIWVYAGIRKRRKTLSPIEIQHEIKNRKKYLPSIKQCVTDMTNRIEYLARTDERLYDLEEYKKEYPIRGWHFKRVAISLGENVALEGYLWARKVLYDNLLFRKVQDEDEILIEIILKLDNLHTEILDKRVRQYAKNIRKALHVAYSYVIFQRLSRTYFKGIPLETKFLFIHERKMKDRVRDLQNGLNARIKELLEGAEDEQ